MPYRATGDSPTNAPTRPPPKFPIVRKPRKKVTANYAENHEARIDVPKCDALRPVFTLTMNSPALVRKPQCISAQTVVHLVRRHERPGMWVVAQFHFRDIVGVIGC